MRAGAGTGQFSPAEHLLNLFDHHKIDPDDLAVIEGNFKELAYSLNSWLVDGPEKTVCLRHLLDAKHAAVRALIEEKPILDKRSAGGVG